MSPQNPIKGSVTLPLPKRQRNTRLEGSWDSVDNDFNGACSSTGIHHSLFSSFRSVNWEVQQAWVKLLLGKHASHIRMYSCCIGCPFGFV